MAIQNVTEVLNKIDENFSLIDACSFIQNDAIDLDDLLGLKQSIKTQLFDTAQGGACNQIYGFGLTQTQINSLLSQAPESGKNPNAIKIYIGYDVSNASSKRLVAYAVAAFDETAGVLDYKIRSAKTIQDIKNAGILIEGTRPCPDNCSKNILSEKI